MYAHKKVLKKYSVLTRESDYFFIVSPINNQKATSLASQPDWRAEGSFPT